MLTGQEYQNIKQANQEGSIKFYLKYAGEYLQNRCSNLGHLEDYRKIPCGKKGVKIKNI